MRMVLMKIKMMNLMFLMMMILMMIILMMIFTHCDIFSSASCIEATFCSRPILSDSSSTIAAFNSNAL